MGDKRPATPSLSEFEVLEGGKWQAGTVGHAFSRLVFNASVNEASGSAQSSSEKIEKPPAEAASRSLKDDSAEASNSEGKDKKVKWPYLSDEDIFASFGSKRAYEREWRKKDKKKGGRKHKNKGSAKDRSRSLDVQSDLRSVEKRLFLPSEALWPQ